MGALYRFADVRCEGVERLLSFTLEAGETCWLQLGSRTEKDAVIDSAIGTRACASGVVEIALADRRHNKAGAPGLRSERRHSAGQMPLIWQALGEGRSGRVAWVAGNGGLISNLKVWENVTLPLWYHAHYETSATEQHIRQWLEVLGIEPDAHERFMMAEPYNLEAWQRKLAGLLRALLQMPSVLVVDAALFDDVKPRWADGWMQAIGNYAADGRAALVLADRAAALPWTKIE